jgi:hypothetical protein
MFSNRLRLGTKTGNIPSLSPSYFLSILVLLPIVFTVKDFTFNHGFLALPRFGGAFREQALEPVKLYAPLKSATSSGYDGQFYAQIALDPSLREPGLKAACDALAYRAKRIALPSLAHFLGGGNAWLTLQLYSILNLFFWMLLAWLLVRHFGCQTLDAQLLLIGVLWSAGTLVSISRALTDLPALFLSIAALLIVYPRNDSLVANRSRFALESNHLRMPTFSWGRSILGAMVFSLAVLTKETALLSAVCLWNWNSWTVSLRQSCRFAIGLLIVAVPFALWSYYVTHTVGRDDVGIFNFTYPGVGFFRKLGFAWSEAYSDFPRLPVLEMLAPLSILVQAFWMVKKVNLNSPWWLLGAGAVLLTVVIGDFVWASQTAYSRCLLPMTVAFNVTLFKYEYLTTERKRIWWWLGNLGLLDRCAIGIVLIAVIRFVPLWLKQRRGDSAATNPDAAVYTVNRQEAKTAESEHP